MSMLQVLFLLFLLFTAKNSKNKLWDDLGGNALIIRL